MSLSVPVTQIASDSGPQVKGAQISVVVADLQCTIREFLHVISVECRAVRVQVTEEELGHA